MLKVKKVDLGRALGVLAKVLSTTSSIAAYRSVRFEGSKQTLQLAATNGRETVTMELPAESDGNFLAVLDFSDLRDLLKGSRPGELTFSAAEHGVSVSENIRGHEISRVLDAHDPDVWPEEKPVPDEAALIELPENFLPLARSAATIVDRKFARPVLSGINLSRDGITSTDAKQLMNLACPLALDKDLTLPFPLALLIAKPTGAGQLQYWQEQDHTCFRMTIGDFTWRSQMLPGSFPDWKQVIPGDEALDYSIRLPDESVVQLKEFLKRIPDQPPHHTVQIQVIADGLAVIPSDFPEMKMVLAGIWNGERPQVPLKLNKYTLLSMLQLECKTFKAHSSGELPVVAEAECSRFVAMPFRSPLPRPAVVVSPKPIEPVVATPLPAPVVATPLPASVVSGNDQNHHHDIPVKGKANMQEAKETSDLAQRAEGIFEELNNNFEELRGKLKALFDQSTFLTRKLKEASLQQKQKERELLQARRAIERIKVVSGF